MPTIIELFTPDAVTDAWRDFRRIADAHNFELIGGTQWNLTPEAELAADHADDESSVRRFLAYVDGEAVGYATARVNLVDSPDSVSVFIVVLPEHRSRGVGRALAEQLRQEVQGFTIYQAWMECPLPGPDDEVLVPPTGAGAVPAGHPAVRLALSYSFELGQIERVSRYDFATPSVDPAEALADAMAHAGADYEMLAWEGPADDDLLGGLGVLRQRMSTDTPTGAMTFPETQWDAERMRKSDEQRLVTNRMFRTVVRHRPSGDVVALNELLVERSNSDAFVDQWDTIVLPTHRGRRLGMAVKAANLIQVRDALPRAESIITWNAEENRYMLAVNEALGYYPILAEAAFELRR